MLASRFALGINIVSLFLGLTAAFQNVIAVSLAVLCLSGTEMWPQSFERPTTERVQCLLFY